MITCIQYVLIFVYNSLCFVRVTTFQVTSTRSAFVCVNLLRWYCFLVKSAGGDCSDNNSSVNVLLTLI